MSGPYDCGLLYDMKALLKNNPSPAIEKVTGGVILRRLVYGAIIVCVLVLAFAAALSRLSMMIDINDWVFGH